jgi:hypothetical protein
MVKKFLTLALCIGTLWIGNSGCSKSCTELKLEMISEMTDKAEALVKEEISDPKVLLTRINDITMEMKSVESKMNETRPECNGKKVEFTDSEKIEAATLLKRYSASMFALSAKVSKAATR